MSLAHPLKLHNQQKNDPILKKQILNDVESCARIARSVPNKFENLTKPLPIIYSITQCVQCVILKLETQQTHIIKNGRL